MSISPSFSETGRFSGRRMPEKSNFSHTCSLLSQYLKEKGTFGDLSLGMTCNPKGEGILLAFSSHPWKSVVFAHFFDIFKRRICVDLALLDQMFCFLVELISDFTVNV